MEFLDAARCRDLSRQSNFWAFAGYAEAFSDAVNKGPKSMRELDLAHALCNGLSLPVLGNGSNAYFDNSRQSWKLSETAFFNAGLPVDAYLVIPEVARLLRGNIMEPWDNRAIDSVRASLGAQAAQALIFAEDALQQEADALCNVRAFDSHLSLIGYVSIMEQLLRKLGLPVPDARPMIEPRSYICDLAGRFSDRKVPNFFFSDRFLVAEENQGQQTGLTRFYANGTAPLAQSLLLLGDSHSYSSLSQLASCLFRKVQFIWTSRRDNYGGRLRQIQEAARQADFVVEEVAERFFLRNFCGA